MKIKLLSSTPYRLEYMVDDKIMVEVFSCNGGKMRYCSRVGIVARSNIAVHKSYMDSIRDGIKDILNKSYPYNKKYYEWV